MQPEEIEGREFFIGLRGYDKDEVNAFLSEVAAEVRTLQARLAEGGGGGGAATAAPLRDDFEDLGANVAAILRTAKESADSMVGDAENQAAQLRADAESYADARRASADEYAEAKRQEGDDAYAAALQRSREAEEHAGRTIAEAEERARQIVAEGEDKARRAVEALVADSSGRLEDTTRRTDELRARLSEAADELQLAVMALGQPNADVRGSLRAAAGLPADEGHDGGQHHEDQGDHGHGG